ncbi:MAG: cytochrome c oxidase assembly protein [Candidatus Rokuibacteriota bacterium]
MAHPAGGWPVGPTRGGSMFASADAVLRCCRLEILFPLGIALALYATGWWRLRRRAPRRARLCGLGYYLAGVGAVGVALLSPLDSLAERSFLVHMLQHLLLINVAAPALLRANPLPTLLWGLPKTLRTRVGRLLAPGRWLRLVWRALTGMPAAGLTYALTLWLWHLPIAYDAALTNRLLHDLEHVAFLGAGALFWWPLIRPAPRFRAGAGPAVRVAYLVVTAFHQALLGLLVTLAPDVLYPSYALAARSDGLTALEDQAWAGILMWGAGGVIDMIATMAVLYQLLDHRDGGVGALSDAAPVSRPAE